MDLKLLSTLRQKMETESDLFKIWGYFLDHFGEDLTFMELCIPTENKLILAVMAQVCKPITKLDLDPSQVMLLSVPGHKFLHGGGAVGRFLVNVIYFEENMQGVVSIVAPFSQSKSHMARFTLAKAPHFKNAPVSFNN